MDRFWVEMDSYERADAAAVIQGRGRPASGRVRFVAASVPQQAWSVLAVGGLALVARLLTGSPGLDADAIQALYWGREIAHGHLPVYHAHFGVVPHPLLIAFAALCTLLGGSAVTAMASMYCVSVGAIIWAGFRLGNAIASPLAGVVAALLLVTNSALLLTTGLGYVDVPFAALVVWAAVLELEGPRRGYPVLVVLGLAGLLRPEAWVLSAFYWAYVSRGPSPSGSRILLAAAVLVAPLIWISSDLIISGDPLLSLQTAQYAANAEHAGSGRFGLPGRTWRILQSLLGTASAVGGLLGLIRAARTREGGALTLASVVVIGILVSAVASIKGLPVDPRYLTYVAVAMTVLAGYAVSDIQALRQVEGRFDRYFAAVAIGLLVWFVASIPSRIAGIENTRAQVRGHAELVTRLQALSNQRAALTSLRSCQHMTAEYAFLATLLGWTADVPAASMPADWSLPSGDSVAVLVETESPAQWPARLIPLGFRRRAAEMDLVLYTRGC